MTVVFCRLAQFQAIFVAIAVVDAVQQGHCWDPSWPTPASPPLPPVRPDLPSWPPLFRAEAEWICGYRADPPHLTPDTLGLTGLLPSLLRYLDEPDQAQALLAQRAAVSGCDPLPAQRAYGRLRSHLIPSTAISSGAPVPPVPPPTATWAQAEALLQASGAELTLALPLALQQVHAGGAPGEIGSMNEQAALLPLVALGCAARGGLSGVPVPWRMGLAPGPSPPPQWAPSADTAPCPLFPGGEAEGIALATALWRRWAGVMATVPIAEMAPAIAEIST
jgi:hypothetical protein